MFQQQQTIHVLNEVGHTLIYITSFLLNEYGLARWHYALFSFFLWLFWNKGLYTVVLALYAC